MQIERWEGSVTRDGVLITVFVNHPVFRPANCPSRAFPCTASCVLGTRDDSGHLSIEQDWMGEYEKKGVNGRNETNGVEACKSVFRWKRKSNAPLYRPISAHLHRSVHCLP